MMQMTEPARAIRSGMSQNRVSKDSGPPVRAGQAWRSVLCLVGLLALATPAGAIQLVTEREAALPPDVAPGASYSPTRNMWRDHNGNRFDLQGRTVA